MAVSKNELYKKLDIAKTRMLQDKFCFFGILALHFKYEIKDDIETACTDGKKIMFGTDFLNKLPIGQVNWIIAHEVMHVANGHLRRKDGKRHDLWNISCDYAIHSILKDFEDSLFKMPEGVLYDRKYNEMSSEQIYYELYQQYGKDLDERDKQLQELMDKLADDHSQWNQGQGQGKDKKESGSEGEGSDGEGLGDRDISEEEWKERMVSAAKQASGRMAGKTPGFLRKILASINPPKKDWRTLLQEFITPEVFDYSFNPPDRRYSMGDCMLPDLNDVDETVKNVVFFVDISGSMSEKDISEVYSEVVGAVSQFSSMDGYLGYFDTQVYNFERFEDISDVLKNKPHSGGGTEFSACFQYLHDTDKVNIDEINGIVILTDGWCGFENCEKLSNGINTLWVMTEGDMKPAPFGRTVYLRNNDKD